jgi:hypothetical protein
MSANHYAAAVVRDPGAKSPAAAPGAEPSYMLLFVLVTGPSLLWAIGANPNDVLIRHKKSVRAYRLQISGFKQLSSAVASSPHCRPAGDGEARIPTRPPAPACLFSLRKFGSAGPAELLLGRSFPVHSIGSRARSIPETVKTHDPLG